MDIIKKELKYLARKTVVLMWAFGIVLIFITVFEHT